MDALVAIVLPHLRAQAEAGAQALQVFDSWVGALGPGPTERSVLPHMRRLFEGLADLDVPPIHFGVGTGELLSADATAGGDVIGVDWRTPLDVAWDRAGHDVRDPGQPRSGGPVGTVGCGRARRPIACSKARRCATATSSTLDTGCRPTPIRRPCGDSWIWSTNGRSARRMDRDGRPMGVLVMAYGTAERARRHRALLHRHPRGPGAHASTWRS